MLALLLAPLLLPPPFPRSLLLFLSPVEFLFAFLRPVPRRAYSLLLLPLLFLLLLLPLLLLLVQGTSAIVLGFRRMQVRIDEEVMALNHGLICMGCVNLLADFVLLADFSWQRNRHTSPNDLLLRPERRRGIPSSPTLKRNRITDK